MKEKQTFLFTGRAVNLGIFAIISSSISAELFTLMARTRWAVSNSGSLGLASLSSGFLCIIEEVISCETKISTNTTTHNFRYSYSSNIISETLLVKYTITKIIYMLTKIIMLYKNSNYRFVRFYSVCNISRMSKVNLTIFQSQ